MLSLQSFLVLQYRIQGTAGNPKLSRYVFLLLVGRQVIQARRSKISNFCLTNRDLYFCLLAMPTAKKSSAYAESKSWRVEYPNRLEAED